jgi:hypothetical protein
MSLPLIPLEYTNDASRKYTQILTHLRANRLGAIPNIWMLYILIPASLILLLLHLERI